jgi:two-component system alkaline phosphatase synthesis response regulator PhoP
MANILIVDDEMDIREILKYNLVKEGYLVEEACDGEEALVKMAKVKPDLVLMDVMMPKLDGIQTCEAIKENPAYSDVLICFLTARAEDYSQIAGLEAGGDDYLTKPIKPKILITRIHALLRRKNRQSVPLELPKAEGLVIDRERHLVHLDGKEIQLPRKEFELLYYLSTKPNMVLKRDAILSKVWGTDVIVGDRTIDVHVRKLREKIGESYISTVKGVGYKFNLK